MKSIYKKIILFLIIIMTVFSFAKQVYAVEELIKIGDINEDGKVDALDRVLVSQHIAASRVPEIAKENQEWILQNSKLKAGDINEDGVINPLDRILISEYIAATRVPEIAKENPIWITYIESKWEIEASSITLDKTTLTLEKGKISKLIATIQPLNVTNKIITWSSSDTGIATVDGIGNVQGKNVGVAIITATTKNGKTANCEVKVTENVVQTQIPQKQTSQQTTPKTTVPKTTTPQSTPKKTPSVPVTVPKSTVKTTPTKNIASLNIVLNPTQVTYNGKAQAPVVTIKDGNTVLKNGTNYTLLYKNNINAGTAIITITGKGNYVGTTTKAFKINKATYNMNSVKFANSIVTYDGKAHSITATGIPAGVKVGYVGNGKIQSGKYTVIAKFTGNATNYNTIADKKATLIINPKAISKATISGIQDKKYTGKEIKQNVVIKDGKVTLKKGTDYTVNYKNNVKVGKATVTINGKGNYFGTISKTFNITKNTSKSTTTSNNSKNKNTSKKSDKNKDKANNKKRVTKVELNKNIVRLKVGQSYQLRKTIYPSDATNKSVTWWTKNSNIVGIDRYGKITARGKGVTYVGITCDSNASKMTAQCIVMVYNTKK